MNKLQKSGFFNPLVLLIFFIGMVFSIFLFNFIHNNIETTKHHEIIDLLQRKTASIQRELDLNLQVLESLKSFYDSSKYVDRDEFKEFVTKPLSKYKSIQALEWIPRVLEQNREQYELNATNDLNVDFNIKSKSSEGKMVTSGVKNEYFPVYYVEPLAGNTKALGFDLSSNSTRQKSLNEARDTRQLAVTAKITLVQEREKQFGFLVFVPIWEKTNKVQLKGFVLGVYRVGDMVKTALNYDKIDSSMLDIWLVDVSKKEEKSILFTNTRVNTIPTTNYITQIDIQGRTWELYVKPSALFILKHTSSLPWIIFFISLFITLLISYVIGVKVSRELDLKFLVDLKTDELVNVAKKYETLVDLFDKKVIASRTDPKGNISYVTSAFCAISGYRKSELMGRNHNIVRHPDMPKELYSELWKTISAGKIFNCELKNRRKDGTFYWVDVIITPEFDDDGKIISYFAIREDITAKKEVVEFNKTLYERVNEEVANNQKKDQLLLHQSKLAAMGEMIGAIAHQWRQPLNTLAIQLQFIEDDFEEGLIDAKYLSTYSKESMTLVNFMSKTIDDFRNFFTVDKMKSNFDIKKKIDETVNMLSAQLEGQNIKLTVEGESFSILGHSSEFQQVVLNIINNAKDALLEKETKEGEITINIEAKDDVGCVRISDNAGGIPKDVIERIFEPYFTTKEQGKGTGLGLYMSKMIVDNMSGELSVHNNDLGAEFIIELGVSHE